MGREEKKERVDVEDDPAGGQRKADGRADWVVPGWPYYKYFMLIDIRAHGSVSCTLSCDSTQCSTYGLRSFDERPRRVGNGGSRTTFACHFLLPSFLPLHSVARS